MSTMRPATPDDARAVAELMESRRVQYQAFQPTFWRVAPDAVDRHVPFLREVLGSPDTIAIVADRDDGGLAGAVLARIVPSPPVYAPGGPTCVIDDYWLADTSAWQTLGVTLLSEVERVAKEVFAAAQAVVVCAQQDGPKRSMLQAETYSVASEWWTKPL